MTKYSVKTLVKYLTKYYFFIFRTSKSKKVTKLGLSVLWKRDNALRVLLTNLELLKSLPRRRRVNFGKKRVLFWLFFLKSKKIQSPPTQKKVSQFLFWRRKIPNYYWLLVILPNSTLSVFNKNQQESTKHTKNRKTPFTWYSLFFWTLYNNSVFTISYFTSVLHYSLLFSWKKVMFWPNRNKKQT